MWMTYGGADLNRHPEPGGGVSGFITCAWVWVFVERS